MPCRKPFPYGQILKIDPPEWPFVGSHKEKITLVRVIEDNGERMVVESAVEGIPIIAVERVVFETISKEVRVVASGQVVIMTPENNPKHNSAISLRTFTLEPVD